MFMRPWRARANLLVASASARGKSRKLKDFAECLVREEMNKIRMVMEGKSERGSRILKSLLLAWAKMTIRNLVIVKGLREWKIKKVRKWHPQHYQTCTFQCGYCCLWCSLGRCSHCQLKWFALQLLASSIFF